MPRCPICRHHRSRQIRSARDAAVDLRETRSHGHRLMHANAAAVFGCDDCGSVFRRSAEWAGGIERRYAHDRAPFEHLFRLQRREVAAYELDRPWLEGHGLRRGRRVLEIGSYVGGFLTCARRVGCAAVGLDIGAQMAAFSRAQDLDVCEGSLEATAAMGTFDVVYVLNCFEQLPNPGAALTVIGRILRPGGQLVLRTPNSDFVRVAHHPKARPMARAQAMLGVPFPRCYSRAALELVCDERDFRIVEDRWDETVMFQPWHFVVAARK